MFDCMGKLCFRTLFRTKVQTAWAVGVISATLSGLLQEEMAEVILG